MLQLHISPVPQGDRAPGLVAIDTVILASATDLAAAHSALGELAGSALLQPGRGRAVASQLLIGLAEALECHPAVAGMLSDSEAR